VTTIGHAADTVRDSPIDPAAALRAHRSRLRTRLAASRFAMVLAVISLLTAVFPPLWLRLDLVDGMLPVIVPGHPHLLPRTAATALVFVSIGLLIVARGLRRGQRLAWASAITLLVVAGLLHLVKGLDVEEAVVSLGGAAWLATRRRPFPVMPTRTAVRRTLWLAVPGAVLAGGISLGLSLLLRHEHRVDAAAVRFDHYISPMAGAAGLALLAIGLWLLVAPHDQHRPTPAEHHRERERARAIVRRNGGGTLDYFALRDDKDWFVVGDTVVAHTVRAGVCLVSPDPIGPVDERVDAWADFLAHVEERGWSLAVLGASREWLPVYEASGLRAVYLGDEAIVDCAAFGLAGSARKSLRQAATRVARAGYTTTFADPTTLTPELRGQVLALMAESRRGEAERGFSMTLSRLFDPDDTDLVLALTTRADGRLDGFVQWAPAPAIQGWSLDIMRRRTDADDVPNGVLDACVVASIEEVARRGGGGLGLNFAVGRQVLDSPESGAWTTVTRPLLQQMSERTQMTSLSRFNDKFGPGWAPRYVVLDAPEFVATQSLVMAGAEGVTEIPVIGRFLRPEDRRRGSVT
jgi:lysyl-tRNA synthetase class 2